MNANQSLPAGEDSLIPKPLSNLTWMIISISCLGISSFPYADFRNRNFIYYLNTIGHYLSFGSPILLILFAVYLLHGFRKRLPIPKTVWIQLGLLLLLALSLGFAYYG
jgi:hypothetical protein